MRCRCEHCKHPPTRDYLIELIRQLAIANATDDGGKAANLVPRVVEEVARQRHRAYGLPLDMARRDVAEEMARRLREGER